MYLNIKTTPYLIWLLSLLAAHNLNGQAQPPTNKKFDYGNDGGLLFEQAFDTLAAPMPAVVNTPPDNVTPTASQPLPLTYTNQNLNQARKQVIRDYKLLRPRNSSTRIYGSEEVPHFDPVDIRMRLSALPTVIPLNYTPDAAAFIDMYTLDKRDQVKRMLSRADLYMSVFEEALDRYNLPLELKYLPVALSALIPHAKAKNGAAGLWQLKYGTAKIYGLAANSFIDERRDPVLATEVAVQHLATLYKKYRDWNLVITAFAAGEAVVNKAMHRINTDLNYEAILPYLPSEARAAVPIFTAAAYVMNYYPEHNLIKYNPPYTFYTTDTLRVYAGVSLSEIAQHINMPIEELQFLNPAIKRDSIPPNNWGFPLTLPVSKVGFVDMYVRARDAKGAIYLNTKPTSLPTDNPWQYPNKDDDFGTQAASQYNGHKAPLATDKNTITKRTKDYRQLHYKVKDGDVLSTIAESFNISTNLLRQWNELPEGHVLHPGDRLIIVLPVDLYKAYLNISEGNQENKDHIYNEIRRY